MRYYIDTEFDGFQGPLISMALVREDGRSLYFVIRDAADAAKDPWVVENVLPILKNCPEPPFFLDRGRAGAHVCLFLRGDTSPLIVADWPDDIRHLCDLLHYSPGEMLLPPGQGLRFEIKRVDAYPSLLPEAVQHNAWWDAVSLQERIETDEARAFEAGFVRSAATAS
jgi:hypothetical protein